MLLLRFHPHESAWWAPLNRFYAGLAGIAETCIGPILRVLQPSPPTLAALLPLLSPSRLFVGEALLQKFSTIYTTPSCCRSNPSLHHTCWTEEGGDVEVPHVCISWRHRHLWC